MMTFEQNDIEGLAVQRSIAAINADAIRRSRTSHS